MELNSKLIKACIKGKRKAQIDLYKLCYSRLFGICIRYKTNIQDAEAAFNLVFLKILDNLSQLDSEKTFFAWARKVLVNTLIDEFRKEKAKKKKEEQADVSSLVNLNQAVVYNEGLLELEAEQLRNMIMALPNMTRLAFNLNAMEGYSHKEVAQLLGMSEGTSKWHVSNARSILQKKILKNRTQFKLVNNG